MLGPQPVSCTNTARNPTFADVPSEMLVRTRVKDAICDALRDAGRPKPLPPDGHAELPLFVSCFQVSITVPDRCPSAAVMHPRLRHIRPGS